MTTLRHSTASLFSEKSNSLPQDFPVNPFPSQGTEEARMMTVSSGKKLCVLLKNADLITSWLKMCLVSSVWNSTTVFLTWKGQATPQHRSLFRLVALMPLTSETEFGYLLRTPDTSGAAITMRLSDQIRLIPTLTANVAKNTSEGINYEKRAANGHLDGVFMQTVGKNTGLRLSPAFAEWMMGYPEGWTDIMENE